MSSQYSSEHTGVSPINSSINSEGPTYHSVFINDRFHPYIETAFTTFTLNNSKNRVYACVFMMVDGFSRRVGSTNWKYDDHDHLLQVRFRNNSTVLNLTPQHRQKPSGSDSILLDKIISSTGEFLLKNTAPVVTAPVVTAPVRIHSPVRIRSPVRNSDDIFSRNGYSYSYNDIQYYMDFIIHNRNTHERHSTIYNEVVKLVWAYLFETQGHFRTKRWFRRNRIPPRQFR